MADHQDDLAASKTEGFKLGEKKTIEEYKQLGMSFSFSLSLSLYTLLYIPVANGSHHPTHPPYLMHIR